MIIKQLKAAYAAHTTGQQVTTLIAAFQHLLDGPAATPPPTQLLARDDLRLICFDHIVS